MNQIDVLAEEVLLRQTLHRFRPRAMFSARNVEGGDQTKLPSEPDIGLRGARREIGAANGKRHRDESVVRRQAFGAHSFGIGRVRFLSAEKFHRCSVAEYSANARVLESVDRRIRVGRRLTM